VGRAWNGAKWIRRERRLAIYLRDGLACVYCGSGLEDEGVTLSLDHIVAVSQGGGNGSRNLVTCCRKCNSVRGDRPLDVFAQAVATYLNRGVDPRDIVTHVNDCASRPVDLVAAWVIVARRSSWQKILEEMNGLKQKEEKS